VNRRLLSTMSLFVVGIPALVAADVPRDIFYKSQTEADASLAKFGLDHPNCERWTNWQRTCARMGDGVHCSRDPGFRVKPSKAFCVGVYPAESVEIQSQFRFCAKYDTVGIGNVKVAVCDKFRADRPFNGRRLVALRSPGCGEWREEGSDRRASGYSATGFYCAKFTHRSCSDLSHHHESRRALTIDGSGISPLPSLVERGWLDKIAVHTIACGQD
jgi:hypothetical protein